KYRRERARQTDGVPPNLASSSRRPANHPCRCGSRWRLDAVVQLTRSGLVVSASMRDLHRLRAQFDGEHCVRLPGFFDAELLSFVQKLVQNASFDVRIHQNIGVELCLTDDVTLSLLYFLSNDPKLFSLVRQITACARI